MNKILLYISLLFISYACVPVQQSNTSQATAYKAINQVYKDSIYTVRLYPQTEGEDQRRRPAILNLRKETPLVLEFDKLGNQQEDYALQIEHYNADWTRSTLKAIEYMDDYNEVSISDYQYSFNTHVRYIHYKALLPKVKITGNYLVKVYKEDNPEEVILTHRFVVYEDKVVLNAKVGYSNLPQKRLQNQQIDFNIYHPNFDIQDARTSISAVIRQNARWDNAITLRPLYVKSMQKSLDFKYYDGQNNFQGDNEFRFFMAESFHYLGYHTFYIDLAKWTIHLEEDQSRSQKPFVSNQDHNGQYVIMQAEAQNNAVDADYMWVLFYLKTPKTDKDIYVVGGFNDWRVSPSNRMTYDQEHQRYQAKILLKQGTYDYAFANVEGGKIDCSPWEGSHQGTENDYDVLIYYRPPGGRFDQVIAYKHLNTHK